MKQTFPSNSQPLSSVKIFPFVFNKAIIQYPADNNKSLIAILCHNFTVQIFAKKIGSSGKIKLKVETDKRQYLIMTL